MIKIKPTQGFTLLEILVVFAIISLLLAIVPPLLPGVIASTNVKSAARELAASLKHVRSQAIDRQKETTLILNIEKNNYLINKKSRNLKIPEDASLSLITAKSEQLSEHEGQIRFFPDGSSTGGQIKLAHAKREYLIDVHWLTGRVKIGHDNNVTN